MPEIPRILHQTWKTEVIPERWRAFADSWRRFHPHWAYRLWTDDELHRLVAADFPALLPTYEAFDDQIQRVDMARLLILVRHGGVYVDLDMECLRPLEPLLEGHTCVLVREPAIHAKRLGMDTLIGNAFVAAVPGEAFLHSAAASMHPPAVADDACIDVLQSTGPMFLTRLYKRTLPRSVSVLGSEVANPLTSDATQRKLKELSREQMNLVRAICLADGAYAIHHWSASWTTSVGGPLTGADQEIEGFTFHPGWDSPGHDIDRLRRDMRALGQACRERQDAAGFNTDGFLKSFICERGEWVVREGDPGSGLYVRNAFHFGGRKPGP